MTEIVCRVPGTLKEDGQLEESERKTEGKDTENRSLQLSAALSVAPSVERVDRKGET